MSPARNATLAFAALAPDHKTIAAADRCDRSLRRSVLSTEQPALLAPGQGQQLGDLFQLKNGVAVENGLH